MISVLMPVYNGESHLKEAIDSILNQTFTDFEFLIINDGSTDSSEDIILSYNDERIRYVINETNLGIVKTLNRGLDLAKHKYIARMDADDISVAHRFAKQVEFMEANSDIAASGSNIIKFFNDDINNTKTTKARLLNNELKLATIFYTAFWHPTMILRTQVLKEYNLRYRSEYKYAQDKALWIDISLHGSIANLKEPLLYYRVHENQVSTKYFAEQYAISMAITRNALILLGVDMNLYEDDIVGFIAYPQRCFNISDLYQVEKFMVEVLRVLGDNPNYDTLAVKTFLKGQLSKTLLKSQNLGLPLISYINKSNFINISDFDLRYFIKVLLKRNTKVSAPKSH